MYKTWRVAAPVAVVVVLLVFPAAASAALRIHKIRSTRREPTTRLIDSYALNTSSSRTPGPVSVSCGVG
jgi:hypothetical protein